MSAVDMNQPPQKPNWLERQIHELVKSADLKIDWKPLDYLLNNVNSITHAIGVILAFVGLVWLSFLSYGKFDQFVGAVVFSICAGALFGASALMHFLTDNFHIPRKYDDFLTNLDLSAIFLLIAGSYTPVILTSIDEPWKTRMLIIIWTVAFVGIITTQLHRILPNWMQSRTFQVCNYLIMGWLMILRGGELYDKLDGVVFGLILAEGVVYSLGAVIYAVKWPNPKPPNFGFHQIWHIFVMMGYLCHLGALLFLYGRMG